MNLLATSPEEAEIENAEASGAETKRPKARS